MAPGRRLALEWPTDGWRLRGSVGERAVSERPVDPTAVRLLAVDARRSP